MFGAKHTYTIKLLKKTTKFYKCGSFARGYLIIAKQSFALYRADAIGAELFSEGLEIHFQTHNNRSLFYDHAIGVFALGPLQIRISDYAHAQILAMTNHAI